MIAPPPCRIGCLSLFLGIVTALCVWLMVQFAARSQSFSGSADLAVVLAIFSRRRGRHRFRQLAFFWLSGSCLVATSGFADLGSCLPKLIATPPPRLSVHLITASPR